MRVRVRVYAYECVYGCACMCTHIWMSIYVKIETDQNLLTLLLLFVNVVNFHPRFCLLIHSLNRLENRERHCRRNQGYIGYIHRGRVRPQSQKRGEPGYDTKLHPSGWVASVLQLRRGWSRHLNCLLLFAEHRIGRLYHSPRGKNF